MRLKNTILLSALLLSTNLYASSLQTANSVNHTTPKVVWQDGLSTVSQSLEINPYGKLVDLNNRSYVFFSHYPASQTRHPFIDEGEFLESVSSNSPNEGIDFEQNPFIYGSGYHDSESRLEYMGARYYSADIGRFVAQDSFDLLNRYNYGNANPIMTIDPDGHLVWGLLPDTWGGAIGMIVADVFMGVFVGMYGYFMPDSMIFNIFFGAYTGGFSGITGLYLGNKIGSNDPPTDETVIVSAAEGLIIGAIVGGLSTYFGRVSARRVNELPNGGSLSFKNIKNIESLVTFDEFNENIPKVVGHIVVNSEGENIYHLIEVNVYESLTQKCCPACRNWKLLQYEITKI